MVMNVVILVVVVVGGMIAMVVVVVVAITGDMNRRTCGGHGRTCESTAARAENRGLWGFGYWKKSTCGASLPHVRGFIAARAGTTAARAGLIASQKCKIGSTPQNEWYFFSHKDKKYPTGTRTNRATEAGFWKATGRDKVVYNDGSRIGLRKTLVFYIGRAPCGQKSDWIMYEYRLDDNTNDANVCNLEEPKAEDGWVVCRLFIKKNHCKAQRSPQRITTSTNVWSQIHNSRNDGDLDQILGCMVKPCKQENETPIDNLNSNDNIEFEPSINTSISEGFRSGFANLPELESPTIPLLPNNSSPFNGQDYSFEPCSFQ
ncbi:hypothetical protein HYC85_018202 [Camellia sinensis]|uniref:NAC domain-containing protein n=1 Tax=Camellia sinensis TaxID=4442 RepID=A0A7J7GVA8_CAMSI|nr:hypothetical protein HYC85_018202 [Camellia sinensis]